MSTAAAPAPAKEKKETPVPESVLKRREEAKKKLVAMKLAKLKARKVNKAKRQVMFKRAEQYLKEYRERQADLVRLRRLARTSGNFFREPEAKLLVVVRIRGINGMSPRTRKILRLLRLRQIHNAVFIRTNKAILNMLRLVEPYITYGEPSLKTVRELIYKRGYSKAPGQRRPLTDNGLIEKYLGKRCGIICIEDLIHEIYTVGPHFKQANKFLWPFKLTSPRSGLVRKDTHFVEGGDAGNRDTLINRLVCRMI